MNVSKKETSSGVIGSQKTAVCTVVAANYLAFARVLARSLARVHPDWHFHVLVLSARGEDLTVFQSGELYAPLVLADIGLAPGDETILPAIYDVTELATAVKPWLLETLLSRGFDTVLYLDPDILVLGSLELLASTAFSEGISLTPHCTEPMPRDGLRPTESDIYLAGIYNLGFLGVSSAAQSMLTWWEERLRRECISAPTEARFVDQRWMDAVPAMFRCGIRREKRFNVAYWNLYERPLQKIENTFYAAGEPLAFFHFSGFNPLCPWILAKYLGQNPRHLLSEDSVLKDLATEYAQMLLAEGFESAAATPYPFNKTVSGFQLTKGIRRRYLAEVVAAEQSGREVPPSPFLSSGDAAFLGWLRQRGSDGEYNAKAAARSDFLLRGDVQSLLEDQSERLLAERLMKKTITLTSLEQQAAAVDRPENVPFREGFTIAGFLTGELGLGTAARAMVTAVQHAGLPFATRTLSNYESREEHPFHEVKSDEKMDANILCVNADSLAWFYKKIGPSFFEGCHNVGFWFWEVEKFPAAMRPAFDLVDEVWAASDFVVGALRKAGQKPVLKFPMPVVEPTVEAHFGRETFCLPPDKFIFLFTFDYLSVFERKNPTAVVQAFRRAFRDEEGPLLVIKSINGDKFRVDRERLRYEAAGRHDVILMDDYLTAGQTAALIAACDCYVSLHRAEGFGLGMAEAMLLGKPVVATGYSGNLEFMTPEHSRLVPYSLIPVGPGFTPYPSGANWAEPDIAAAASILRELASSRETAVALGRKGQLFAREKLSINHSVEFLKARREEINQLREKKAKLNLKKSSQRQGLLEDWRLPPEAAGSRSPLGRFIERLSKREAQRRRSADRALAEAVRALRDDLRLIRKEVTERLDTFEDHQPYHDK